MKESCGNTSESSCPTETICVQGAVFIVNPAERGADGRRRPNLSANLPGYTRRRAIHGRRTSGKQRSGPDPQLYAQIIRFALMRW